MRKSLLVPALLLASALGPAAANTAYVGLDWFAWRYQQEQDADVDLRAGSVRARAGVDLTPYLGLEGHFATGGSDSERFAGIRLEGELDALYSAMVKGMLPLGGCCNLYGLLGVTRAEADVAGVVDVDDSGYSYGVGGEIRLTDQVYATTDWVHYLAEDEYDFSAWSFGARVLF